MKKLVIVAALAMFGFNGFAQMESHFGVKAGVNFAKLTGDNVEDADGRTGFHIGAIYELMVGEKFFIQPELVYSQQGLQSKVDDFETKLKLDYLNIPVMAKYYISEDFAIEAGPQVGILMNAKGESDGRDTDVKDFFKGSDISLGGGLSYNMETGLFLQARYMIGISNVFDGGDEDTFGDDLTNSVLSFSVGYMF
ncbi:Outer membrane protein beta-barrel domain-containing protein [Flavobacteriaceae bacterium MAR_2010_188]|nr:Outer membrane protein beta-barrel domain-containing protein [Flavobacteriaceae bacterium MAR_2010_188]